MLGWEGMPARRAAGAADAGAGGAGGARAPERFLAQAMEELGDAVLRLALSQLRDAADAEDVFQEVFLRLLSHGPQFNGEDHLRAWLLRVTLNRCRDYQRARSRRRTDPYGDLEQVAGVSDGAGLAGSDIWDAVGLLPEDMRAVIHLFYVEGYATDEIGRLVGCKAATVRTRLHRARRLLREALEPQRELEASDTARAAGAASDARRM